MSKPVFFIDDDAYERRSCTDVLNEIFEGTSVRVEPLSPLPTLADYSGLVANQAAAALIIDERLNTAGGVTYTGAELAAHLRAIGGNLPIVILTNYPDDDFNKQGWAVESIIAKKRVLNDPTSRSAQEFKARLSRQIEIAGAVLAKREQRFHDLLVKSLKEKLTPEEEKELGVLEAERVLPVQAEELSGTKALQKTIEELKAKLKPDQLKL
jgi:hypothetical protein